MQSNSMTHKKKHTKSTISQAATPTSSANTVDAGFTPYVSKKIRVDDDLDELRYSPVKSALIKVETKPAPSVIIRKFMRGSNLVAIYGLQHLEVEGLFRRTNCWKM
jgi:hypothetical protein